MTFLDSSVIVGYLDDDARIVEYVDAERLCEFLDVIQLAEG